MLSVLTLLGVATTMADTLVATPDTLEGATTATQAKYGFTLDFGKSAAFTLNGAEVADFTVYSSILLTSVSITTEATNYGDVKLAVYKVASTSPDTANWSATPGIQNFESYEGVSEVGSHANGQGVFTFTAPLELDPTAWYAFMFVRNDRDESTYSTGNNLGAAAVTNGYSKNFLTYSSGTAANSGLVWGDMLNAGGSTKWNNTQTAVASYTFTATPAVPEPATATLSLLALAGLAARRRRK